MSKGLESLTSASVNKSYQITVESTRNANLTGLRLDQPSPATKMSPFRPWDYADVALLLLLVFGLVGNALTIVIMNSRRMRRSNAALFIICMAFSDILLLVLKFTSNMIKIYRLPIYNACIYIQVLSQASSFMSAWLVVITSAERAVAVITPFRVAHIFSKKHCQYIMIGLLAFFISLSSTITFCIEYKPSQPYYCQIKGEFEGKCFVYYNYIFPWLRSSLFSWIPSVLIIGLNVTIILELYKALNARKAITNGLKQSDSSNNCSLVNREIRNTINHSLTIPAWLYHSTTHYELPERTKSIGEEERELTKMFMKQRARLGSLLLDKSFFTRVRKYTDDSILEEDEDGEFLAEGRKSRRSSLFNLKARHSADTITLNSEAFNQSHFLKHMRTRYSYKEKQITIMLLTASLLFIMLTLPQSVFDLLRKLNVNWSILKSRSVHRTLMLLLDINHATNFIMYCVIAQRFRAELRLILTTKWLTSAMSFVATLKRMKQRHSQPRCSVPLITHTSAHSKSDFSIKYNQSNL